MACRMLQAAAFGAAILALGAARTQALTPDGSIYVEFTRPVALPGVELPPGGYIFELAEPGLNHQLVRVLSRDRRKVLTTQFTVQVERPTRNSAGGREFTFHEAPPGAPLPLKAWYPSGHSIGHEFVYSR